jgi:imidazoleglycerol-phosphate dehydratase/histidinol-phosphatase
MKKVLFIDRDGTIINETKDEKINNFSELTFYPMCLTYLGKIARELYYELVMITNQDGLGTEQFPENEFWEIHNFIIKTFQNEGIVFCNVFIDKTYPYQNAPTRKPGTALLKDYINNPNYDLKNSFMIGDRLTDVELAKNLGAKAIYINNNEKLDSLEIQSKKEELDKYISLQTTNWKEIYKFLK